MERVRVVVCLVLWLTCSVCTGLGAASRVRAEGPADASVALRGALSAYERGDMAEARRWFEQAHAAEPTARTLRGLGVVAYRQERTLEAYAYLTQSLVASVKPLTAELRAGVQQLVNELGAQLVRVHLQRQPEQALLEIDGAEPLYDASGAALLLPGVHRARLRCDGYVESSWQFEAQAGSEQLRSWQLSPEAAPAAIVAAPVQAQPRVAISAAKANESSPKTPVTTTASRGLTLRRAGYGTAALMAAAVVLTAVSVGLGVQRVRAIEDACRRSSEHECSKASADALSRDAKLPLLSGLSIGGAVLSGVGGVATTWLFVAARRGQEGAGASLGVRITHAF